MTKTFRAVVNIEAGQHDPKSPNKPYSKTQSKKRTSLYYTESRLFLFMKVNKVMKSRQENAFFLTWKSK